MGLRDRAVVTDMVFIGATDNLQPEPTKCQLSWVSFHGIILRATAGALAASGTWQLCLLVWPVMVIVAAPATIRQKDCRLHSIAAHTCSRWASNP